MARTVDLTTLESRVRWRTDTENEVSRFPVPELDDAINEGIAKFHSRAVRARGQGWQEATTPLPTVNGQELYGLPATYLEVLKVWTTLNGCEVVIPSYEEPETDGLSNGISWAPGIGLRYRLSGDNISFRPVPDAVYTVNIKYVPTAVKLTSPSSMLDGIDGLEEFVVAWAAKRWALKNRDYELARALDEEMAIGLQEIDGLVHAHNAGEPPRMQDVRGLYLPRRHRWLR